MSAAPLLVLQRTANMWRQLPSLLPVRLLHRAMRMHLLIGLRRIPSHRVLPVHLLHGLQREWLLHGLLRVLRVACHPRLLRVFVHCLRVHLLHQRLGLRLQQWLLHILGYWYLPNQQICSSTKERIGQRGGRTQGMGDACI